MKVFEINVVYGTGSTGRIVASLKHAIESEGGECIAAYGRGNLLETGTYRIGSDLDMYLHALLTRITDKTAFYSKRSTKKLIKEIRRFEPDVIHLHNLHGYFLNIEILFDFLKKYGKPVVWTLHDCWAFTGHCPYFTYVRCERWKSRCYECIQKQQYPASRWKDNSRQNHERKQKAFTGMERLTLVTPSNWLRDLLEESFLKSYCVRVIHNGVDVSRFRPTESSFRSRYHLGDKFLLLGVANLWSSERKGLSDFIRLAEKLEDDCVIILVGTPGRPLADLPERILSIPHTENIDELVEIYSSADIFLNLTYEDNYPTVNLEALACGTPVLTYASGGSPESVSKKSGFVVKPGDLDAVMECIIQYRRHPEVFNLGENDFDRGFLDERNEVSAYLQLMHEVTDKSQI